MPIMTPEEYDAYLIGRYRIGQEGIDKVAARLLWCENRAGPCDDDVDWDRADEPTRDWYRNRVREVLDEYLAALMAVR